MKYFSDIYRGCTHTDKDGNSSAMQFPSVSKKHINRCLMCTEMADEGIAYDRDLVIFVKAAKNSLGLTVYDTMYAGMANTLLHTSNIPAFTYPTFPMNHGKMLIKYPDGIRDLEKLQISISVYKAVKGKFDALPLTSGIYLVPKEDNK